MNAPSVTRGRNHAERGARRAANSRAMGVAARWGLASRGVIYLLMGAIALRIAFGGESQEADRGGALQELASRPFGAYLVWAVGIGLAGMALWRLSEAAVGVAGPDGHKASKRVVSGFRGLAYAVITYSVLAVAAGAKSSGSNSSDKQSKDATTQVLDLPAGQWLVGAAGVAIAAAGVWTAGKALMRKYHDELKLGEMSATVRRIVDVLGVGGGTARGVVFAAVGVFVVQAAVQYDPDEAEGLDNTLRSFAETPAGPWLLVVVATGLVLFGAFSLAMARYRKV
ncbi:DUF1206 domain-containing protein [Streptomyces sp. 549]|uniref:DUF1206 domain-containing protein n=1 Tax=Streptomyces sp. 549 TaxID=3049076 RepID=UPI0024C35070|nr:DUF1206 domain-containing protein [Streptomyces sp. 549]MDK1471935.1 DUF1206 domain-containing protein [Streptomyces sp. 549]